ncbi:MAG: hypothetical protein M1827_001866 [Pycnora praestabilis]|nr:MAG: hypothetical protein M1827_001866 [Pycnora praestabilis]
MPGTNGAYANSTMAYGHQMRKHYLFDEKFTNLNHGSFGTYPKPVQSSFHHYQDLSERAPDPFIRYEYPKMLDTSRQAMATYLNVHIDTIVFVPNATTGFNTVLRNLLFEPRDKIVYFATIYGSFEKTVEYITETTPAEALKIQYTYPVSDEWLVTELRNVIRKEKAAGNNAKVVIFDTVTSLPGVRVPFERLTGVCREEGVLSLVDGAHGVGHIPLDLGNLQPDFFVSNCHKWLDVPRGCAILHVPLHNQDLIRSTLPTSFGFEPYPSISKPKINSPFPPPTRSKFVSNFQYVGTLDNSPYLCIPDGLRFRKELCGGEEKIMAYNTDLAKEAGQRVASILGTEVLQNEEGTLTNCCFANVRLPLAISSSPGLGVKEADAFAAVQWMCKTMIDESNTFMAIVFYGGAFWFRLSGQIYLELSDFEWAAGVLKGLCERVAKGEFLGTGEAES